MYEQTRITVVTGTARYEATMGTADAMVLIGKYEAELRDPHGVVVFVSSGATRMIPAREVKHLVTQKASA